MTREQQKRLNAMCGDLAAQVTWFMRDGSPVKLHRDDWRHIFAGLEVGNRYVQDPEDRSRLVTLAASSRGLTVEEASDVMQRIAAFGAEMKVNWSDPEWQAFCKSQEAA